MAQTSVDQPGNLVFAGGAVAGGGNNAEIDQLFGQSQRSGQFWGKGHDADVGMIGQQQFRRAVIGVANVGRVLGTRLGWVEVRPFHMCPQDLRARVIGAHPLLGKIQTAHQIFNVISGSGGEQAGNAIGRSGLGDRAECLCAWLVKSMTLRPVDVNVNQPWRDQPPFRIKLIEARIDILRGDQPRNPPVGHKQRLPRHHLIR